MPAFERGRALVVGVGVYGDPDWDVPTATRDARGLYDTLSSPDLGGYLGAQAELLTDADATREGVLAGLRRLADRCGPESVALVSFTCHGALGEDGLYYLATSGARFAAGQNRVVRDSGLHVADLARALREVPARQLLLVVNACASGEILGKLRGEMLRPEDAGAGQMLPDDEVNTLLATGEGRAVITASRADQRSYFKREDAHSYFGQALIDTLRGGLAGSTRRFIGLYELYEGVYRQVRAVTQRRLGADQEPVLTVVQSAGPFPVALNPVAAGDDPTVVQRPAGDLPVRPVIVAVAQATSPGATAINAAQGSTVTVDNSKLIDFGGATVMGNVKIGDVARGDIVKIGSLGGADTGEEPLDPLQALPLLRERVAVARNVDEDARDDAANKLSQAHRALTNGDASRARQRLVEALAILRAMDNGYIRSVTRKIEAVRDAV